MDILTLPASKPEKQPSPTEIEGKQESTPENDSVQESAPKKEYQPDPLIKSSTPSIKNALSTIKNATSPNEEPDSIPQEESILNAEIDIVSEANGLNKVSEEDLHAHWERYIDKLKSEEPRMFNVLSSQKPRLISDLTIEVVFLNNAQLIDFKQKIKISLLASLKESLNNSNLEIVEIVQGEEYQPNTKHYTDTDKLKHMIEKNPSLQKLRQEFNLDFE